MCSCQSFRGNMLVNNNFQTSFSPNSCDSSVNFQKQNHIEIILWDCVQEKLMASSTSQGIDPRFRKPSSASSPGDAKKRKQQNNSDVGEITKDILVSSIPYMLIGGAAGVLFHSVGKLFSKPKMVRVVDYDEALAEFPCAREGWPVTTMNAIQMSSRIHPSWMKPFLSHANELRKCANEMADITDAAMKLIPAEMAASYQNESFKGAVGQQMSQAVKAITDLFSSVAESAVSSDNKKTKSQATTTSYKLNKSTVEKFERDYDMIGKMIASSNELIANAYATRVTLAAMLTELRSTMILFNEYWVDVGSIVMVDVDLKPPSEVSVFLKQKLDIMAYLLDYGSLPSWDNPDNSSSASSADGRRRQKLLVLCDETKKSLLKWWATMHLTFLPQMFYTCNSLGIQSVYNPTDSMPDNQHNERGEVGVLWSGSAKSSHGNSNPAKPFDASSQGHLFLATHEQEKFLKNAGNNGSSKAPTAGVLRPSANSSLKDQLKFWLFRVKSEGWKSIIDSPWAGYLPACDEPCFLPTTPLKMVAHEAAVDTFLRIADETINFLYKSQATLLNIYVTFRNFWHPDLLNSSRIMKMSDEHLDYAKMAMASIVYHDKKKRKREVERIAK